MWHTHSSPSRTALLSVLFLGLLLAAQTLGVSVRHRAKLVDADVQETLSSLYNSITDEQNFIEDKAPIQDPILDLPAGHSPIADIALGNHLSLPSLPNGASQSALVETEAASTADASAAAEASLKAATAALAKVDLFAEVKSTQMDKVTAEMATRETVQTGSSMPPFEALPSMAPHDGLDGDSFGPLSNPGKFDGNMMDPIARIEAIKLPPASSLVPRYLGSDLPLNDMRFTPVGSSSLPPLVGPQVGGRPARVPDPKLVLPDHPDLQLVDSFGIPGQVMNDGLPPLPPPLPPLDVTPDVAAALNAAHTSISHYPGGAPMAPQVNLPHPPDPKAAMDLDALAFPIAPPVLSPILPPVVGTPANNKAFHGYATSRQQYSAQRAAALATMDARRKQIDQLQQWVDSGDTYIAQKQAQVSSWVAQERARANLALDAQKQKVEAYRRHLTALQQQQKEDAKRLNMINTELRRLSVQYQLTLHQESVAQTEAQAKKLQDELKQIKSKKDGLEKEMKDISAEMGAGKSKGGDSAAAAEAGGEEAASAGSNGAAGDAAAGSSAEF